MTCQLASSVVKSHLIASWFERLSGNIGRRDQIFLAAKSSLIIFCQTRKPGNVYQGIVDEHQLARDVVV